MKRDWTFARGAKDDVDDGLAGDRGQGENQSLDEPCWDPLGAAHGMRLRMEVRMTGQTGGAVSPFDHAWCLYEGLLRRLAMLPSTVVEIARVLLCAKTWC